MAADDFRCCRAPFTGRGVRAGPQTQEGTGSAFLCIENDDPTAERKLKLFNEFGIPVREQVT
jgi:hypothetical protein